MVGVSRTFPPSLIRRPLTPCRKARGGQYGEMRTMMQYLFQSINFRGDRSAKPYKDLPQGIGTEEISHVELIGSTIARPLDGSPAYQGKKNDPLDKPGATRATPLKIALDTSIINWLPLRVLSPYFPQVIRARGPTSTTAGAWSWICCTT